MTVDVTPRRVQRFKVAAGEVVKVSVGNAAPRELRADSAGRLTVTGVRIESRDGARIRITR